MMMKVATYMPLLATTTLSLDELLSSQTEHIRLRRRLFCFWRHNYY